MNIALCGSMEFAKKMVEIKRQLIMFGHKVILPQHTAKYAVGKKRHESKWAKIEGDLIRGYYNKIKDVDAILIVNITKNGVTNYVGGNAFIELAFGHVLRKKCFLLNPIPEGMNYTDEIEAMQPTILSNDLIKIS